MWSVCALAVSWSLQMRVRPRSLLSVVDAWHVHVAERDVLRENSGPLWSENMIFGGLEMRNYSINALYWRFGAFNSLEITIPGPSPFATLQSFLELPNDRASPQRYLQC